ncbi:MAG: hypothetical protein L0177_06355, partial [Chloroflexi bacterium]|nr:hypothetical protein [Chloroflexota bacterium]
LRARRGAGGEVKARLRANPSFPWALIRGHGAGFSERAWGEIAAGTSMPCTGRAQAKWAQSAS